MENLDKQRNQYHVSIRKATKNQYQINIRNNLQRNMIEEYVHSLDIKSQPCPLTFQELLNRFLEQRNDIEIRCELFKYLVYTVKFIRQKGENLELLVLSRIPAAFAAILQIYPKMRIMEKYNNSRDRVEKMLKYVQYQIDSYVQDQDVFESFSNQLSQLLQLPYLQNQNIARANRVLYFFASYVYTQKTQQTFSEYQILDKIFELIKMKIIFQKMIVQAQNNIQELKPQELQQEFARIIDPILSSVLIFFRNYLINSNNMYKLSQDQINIVLQLITNVIHNCQFYLHEQDYRYNKQRVEQLTHAVYIYQRLLVTETLGSILKLQDIFESLEIIILTRFRHFALFKYVIKIAIKFARHSSQHALFLLNRQSFINLIRSTQRVNFHEVVQMCDILLEYPNSQVILKPAIVIIILDIPDVIEHERNMLFKLMFKYYRNKQWKGSDPETCIILKKLSEKKETEFWTNLLHNGYTFPIPMYLKEELYDVLTEKQKEDIDLRSVGRDGCRW